MTQAPKEYITDGIESHPQRCENNCPNKRCYFHPNMGTKEHGLDIDHPITIREFVRRFGCATYACPLPAPAKHFKEYHHCDEEFDELKTVNAMLEAEVDRLTGIEIEAARNASEKAILECRKIVGDKVIFNKCPFGGDCGKCFLCDNTGGCIISSDVEIRNLVNKADRKAREDVVRIITENKEEIIKRLSQPFSPEVIKEMQEIVRKHESLRHSEQEQGGSG